MPGAASTVSVLAILPAWEDQISLRQIFWHSNWSLHFARDVAHARDLIDEIGVGVVICDGRLPDGSWQDVLREVQRGREQPVLIVVSRVADDQLWAEVLNLGGYDVLAMPFEAAEVVRSVSVAWRHWQDKLAVRDRLSGRVMAAGSRSWPRDS